VRSASSTTWSWSIEPAAATTTDAGTYRRAWNAAMSATGVSRITGARPMIGRPRG
jgi:hypothetical protein